jgi:hypothetical protein
MEIWWVQLQTEFIRSLTARIQDYAIEVNHRSTCLVYYSNGAGFGLINDSGVYGEKESAGIMPALSVSGLPEVASGVAC